MGRFDWEYELLQAAETAQRRTEHKGGVREPSDLGTFLQRATEAWQEAEEEGNADRTSYWLVEKRPDGREVRKLEFQFYSDQEADEMTRSLATSWNEDDNHWEVVK